jgi:hypothetical protein
VALSIHDRGDDFLLSVCGGSRDKREWRRDMRDRAKAVLSARTASKQADKIIDLDSWETGYADGELGRAAQCPIGCYCHPSSYSIGITQVGRLAQERVGRLRDSAIRNCRSRCVELDRRRDFPLPPRLGDSVSFSCPWGLAR